MSFRACRGSEVCGACADDAHVRCDGDKLTFNYRMSESEQKWLLEDFKARLAALAEVCSVEADTPAEAARAVLDYMASSFTPDPDASASPLTALMEGIGNDDAFDAAGAYVSTQLGIEMLPETLTYTTGE